MGVKRCGPRVDLRGRLGPLSAILRRFRATPGPIIGCPLMRRVVTAQRVTQALEPRKLLSAALCEGTAEVRPQPKGALTDA